MDRVAPGFRPERDHARDTARRMEWRRRKAAGRNGFAQQLKASLNDNASDLRRTVAALQGSGFDLSPQTILDLQLIADDIDMHAAQFGQQAVRSVA